MKNPKSTKSEITGPPLILNAIIESTNLGFEDHGFLNAWITLDFGGTGQGFGGFVLYLPKSFDHHSIQSCAGHFLFRVMEIAGVTSWDKLKGRSIRVKKTDPWGKILAIGHVIKDDWFSPEEDFSSLTSAPSASPR